MENKRAMGVTIFAILNIVGGIAAIILNIKYVFSDYYFPYLFIGLGLYILIIGIGLLNLKEWARRSEIIICTFCLVSTFIFSDFIILGVKKGLLTNKYMIKNLIALFEIYYFTRLKVKEQFKSKDTYANLQTQ